MEGLRLKWTFRSMVFLIAAFICFAAPNGRFSVSKADEVTEAPPNEDKKDTSSGSAAEAPAATQVPTPTPTEEPILSVVEVDSVDLAQKWMDKAGKRPVTLKLTADFNIGDGNSPFLVEEGMNTTFDLNGHTIDRGINDGSQQEDGYVFKIEGSGKLYITDSSETPGKITGASMNGNGGGICCDKNSFLKIDGGISLEKNVATKGAGIFVNEGAEVQIGSCSIVDNYATENGGGIYGSNSSIVTFLGGVTRIKNNTCKNDRDDDLFISTNMEKLRFWVKPDPSKNAIVYSSKFLNKTRIGFTLEKYKKVITDGYGDVNSLEGSIFFFCNDNEKNYQVSSENTSEVEILKNMDLIDNSQRTSVEIYKNDILEESYEYSSLSLALKNAIDLITDKNGKEAVITMGADYSSSSELVIPAGKKITLDLNGHYIQREGSRDDGYVTNEKGGVIRLEDNAYLKIIDSKPKKMGFDGLRGGVITGGATDDGGGGIFVGCDAKLVMEGGTIYDCVTDYHGGGIFMDSGGEQTEINLKGVTISNCKTIQSVDECFGGAIYDHGCGIITLTDCRIENCYSEDDGGAIYFNYGELNIKNTVFNGNIAEEHGGVIYICGSRIVSNTIEVSVRGCSFTENEAGECGGVLYVDDSPVSGDVFIFDRCKFIDNKAKKCGGAIYVNDLGLVLSNVEMTGNVADDEGGAVYVARKDDITVKGVVVIKDNISRNNSKAIDMFFYDEDQLCSGGLTRGSWIGIGCNCDGDAMISKSITVYEMKYFHAAKGKIEPRNIKTINTRMSVTASIFGNGSVGVILVFGGLGLIALTGAVIYGKKKKLQV
ncbi:MAG: hypothetical protein K6F77_08740 [Lachnospiraceae bacterium]|nr:hypothetical protein [Lachnospiraceae bacterium]